MRTFLLTACAASCLAVAAPSLAPAEPTPVAAKKKSCKPKAEANGCKLKKAEYSVPDVGGTAIVLTVGQYLAPWKTDITRWCHLRDGAPVPFRIQSNIAPTIGRTLKLTTIGGTVNGDPGTYVGSATAKFSAKSVKVTFAMSVSYDGSEQCSLSDTVKLKRVR